MYFCLPSINLPTFRTVRNSPPPIQHDVDVCIFSTVNVQPSHLANAANSYVTKSNTNTVLITQLRELQHRKSSIQNTLLSMITTIHIIGQKWHYEHMEECKKYMDYTF